MPCMWSSVFLLLLLFRSQTHVSELEIIADSPGAGAQPLEIIPESAHRERLMFKNPMNAVPQTSWKPNAKKDMTPWNLHIIVCSTLNKV